MIVIRWQLPRVPLRTNVVIVQGLGLLAVVVLASIIRDRLKLSELYLVKAGAMFAGVMLVAIGFVGEHHPFARFGPANQTTTVRAAMVALVASLIGEPKLPLIAEFAAGATMIVAGLDGLDGWLARRTGMASAFGARFDMETDALLVMALSVLAWQHGKAGAWVLASGLWRYVFLAGGLVWPWLRRPLPRTRRAAVVCVVQILCLALALAPIVEPPLSYLLAALGLAALSASFLADVIRLRRYAAGVEGRRQATVDALNDRRWWHLAGLVCALTLLNASLAFQNVWPTPAVRWRGELSVECAVCVLAMAVASGRVRAARRGALRWLAAFWVLLVLGRYADVTAQALYGRPINLFWDLRQVSAVAAMLAGAASVWLILLVVAAAVVVPLLLYGIARWALGRIEEAMARPGERVCLGLAAAAVLVLFVAQPLFGRPRGAFSTPVTQTYSRQARLLASELTGADRKKIGAGPSMNSDLLRLGGADVFVIFLESYGAVSYEGPEFAAQLAPSRAKFDAAIRATGRDVVSAYVESPTFGGSSWLAHVSLLSGVEVRDEDTDVLLKAQKRETLATVFARHGYRTVAIMPGLRQSWPEGAFYGFDDIYSWTRLDYGGPPFGWWDIPDQYAIARMDALEIARPQRAPVLVFFPTTSTHTPFVPVPPYQPDWRRVLSGHPYDEADLTRAWLEQPDWLNLAPSYVRALSYAYESLGGYLQLRADRDFVMIILGDHQPPALVSGEGAPWDVPVHVVASRRPVLESLRMHGFRAGLTPAPPAIARMHALLPVLLEAFGRPQ